MSEQPHWDSCGISPAVAAEILRVLSPYSGVITKVGVFGSRAQNVYRSNSDIDLVLYGPIPTKIIHRLTTEFLESRIGVTVDLVAYETLEGGIKHHIDEHVRIVLSFD